MFRSSKFGTVAGCIVMDGYVRRNNPIRVLRDNVVIFEGGLESLRRFKDDVNEVRAGTECGIGVKNYNDVRVGDQIECYSRVEVARTVAVIRHANKAFPRSQRIAQQIQQTLSELIRRELRDPRLGMVTLTEVRMSKDLSYAKVYFSVLGAQPPAGAGNPRGGGAAAARPARPRARHPPQPGAAVRAGRADRERRAPVGADPEGRQGRRRRVTSTTKTSCSRSDRCADSRIASPCPSPGRFYRAVSGILLLDKALGVSSNAALQQVRALFSAAKAGHAGSLDPLASGLLPVCFGQATKVCGRLLNSGKTYRVLVQLGERTESGDGETEVVERAAVPPLDDRAVDAVLATFLGEQEQVPPMHSALKFEGKRLYELARRGESVEREPRRIVIHRIARVRLQRPTSWSSTSTAPRAPTSGRWPRTSRTALGTLGYVRGLRRLSLDPFGDLPMYTLEQLAERTDGGSRRAAAAARSGLPGPAAGRARHRGRRGIAAGKDSRGAAAGRAGRAAGLRRPRQVPRAWCRARRTAGSGRSGCS